MALEIPDADEDFDHPALPESQPLRGTSFTGLLPLLIKGAAGLARAAGRPGVRGNGR